MVVVKEDQGVAVQGGSSTRTHNFKHSSILPSSAFRYLHTSSPIGSKNIPGIAMSSLSSFATGPTATSVPTALPPPIVQVLPYISQAASFLLTATTITFQTLFSLITQVSSHLSIISPLPIISYLLAPIIVFFQILVDLLVFTPYSITIYALDAFYPIYVFCGVACIAGATIGVIARGIAMLLVTVSVGPEVDSESEVAKQVGYQTGTSIKVEENP